MQTSSYCFQKRLRNLFCLSLNLKFFKFSYIYILYILVVYLVLSTSDCTSSYTAVYNTFSNCFYYLENPVAYLKRSKKIHFFLKTIFIMSNRCPVTDTTQEYICVIGSQIPYGIKMVSISQLRISSLKSIALSVPV